MSVLVEKLTAIGGQGPSKAKDWRIRCRLGWHTKSKSAVRHMLRGDRKIALDEAKQIEAAHFKFCAERAVGNHDENRRLFETMRQSIVAMEASDPDFFRPHIEEVGRLLHQLGYSADHVRHED